MERSLNEQAGCDPARRPAECPAWRVLIRNVSVTCYDRGGKEASVVMGPGEINTHDAVQACEAVRIASWAVSVVVRDGHGRTRTSTGLGGRCGQLL